MKVLALVDYYPLDRSEISGGVAAAAYNLIESLLRYTDLTVTTLSFIPTLKSRKVFSKSGDRLKIVRLPGNWRLGGLMNYSRERRIFRRVVEEERPDIVHAQGEGLYASLAVKSGLPDVYTIHGLRLNELKMEREHIGTLRYLLRTRLIRSHHKEASNIVAINAYTRAGIEKLHQARVRTIGNAIDETFFDLYLSEQTEVGNILLVGGVRRRKDVITALKAVRHVLKDGLGVTLHIVGPIEADYYTEVERFIDSNELRESVEIHGLITDERIRELYTKADLLLLTSTEESSPICIYEAMAAGKPIVSTNVGGVSEMIKNGSSGYLLDVRDDISAAKAIIKVVTDRKLRERLGHCSREIAASKWSAKAVALDTYNMYREILNGE